MSLSSKTSDEQAALWADRLRDGALDVAEAAALEAWLAADPERRALLDEHRAVLTDPALTLALKAARAPAAPRPRKSWLRSAPAAWAGMGLAGAVAVAAALAIAPGLMAPGRDILRTEAGHTAERRLDDGSVIRLNGGSAVEIVMADDRREMRLNGEGFFDVARDEARPFSVITADYRVTALGTRFNVDERTGGALEVLVQSGRVEVAALNDPARAVRLGAGERVRMTSEGPRLGRVEAAMDPSGPGWTSGWIEADETSLPDLLLALERQAPGFRARLARPGLAEKQVSGRFPAARPDQVVQAVAQMHGLTVRTDASGVVVLGE